MIKEVHDIGWKVEGSGRERVHKGVTKVIKWVSMHTNAQRIQAHGERRNKQGIRTAKRAEIKWKYGVRGL